MSKSNAKQQPKQQKKQPLTRTEYKEKFEKLMSKFNYVPQEGEIIVQCHEQYPPYWFLSNKGYLFSAYYNDLKMIEPIFDRTSKANAAGERPGKNWRYSRRKESSSNLQRYDMAKMIAEHFLQSEFDTDEDLEAHHIKKRTTFRPDEAALCNRADNLQLLPKSIHKKLTHYASKTSEQLDQEIADKVKAAGAPEYQLTQEQLQQILFNALQSCLNQGIQPITYSTTVTDDVAQIEAEAHPVRNLFIVQQMAEGTAAEEQI